jgi:hypothetical protein
VSGIGLLKDELITPESDAAAGHPGEGEAPFTIEIEDGIWCGELIRIASDPIEDVVPPAHAAAAAVLRPRSDVVSGTAAEQRSR